MPIVARHTPERVCFAADEIKYSLWHQVTIADNPVVLTFQIETPSLQRTQVDELEMICYPMSYPNRPAGSYYDIDISDIITGYVQKLYVDNTIYGHIYFQLTKIDGSATDIDSIRHLCLPGTNSGLDMSAAIPADVHSLLIARSSKDESIHFFRSELLAMEYIYAIMTDVYEGAYFLTNDISDPTNTAIKALTKEIDGEENLIALHYLPGWRYGYDIAWANTIYLHLSPSAEYQPAPRMYAIAIEDDPDTDETHLLRWTNSMGATEALLLTGELQDISEMADPELYISEQNSKSTIRAHQRRTLTQKYAIHTGYLDQGRIDALIDMLSSDHIELYEKEQWMPVSVTSDIKHAAIQRTPEDFELEIEVLEQPRYHKPGRVYKSLPQNRSGLLQDNSGDIITDNKSNTIY